MSEEEKQVEGLASQAKSIKRTSEPLDSDVVSFARVIARQIEEKIVLAEKLLENEKSTEAKALIEKQLIHSLGRLRDRSAFCSIH